MHRLTTKAVVFLLAALAGAPAAFGDDTSWLDRTQAHVSDIWRTGTSDIYLPLYTHHLRSKYTREQIDGYQETPYGLGYGRSKFDEDGDWKGLYAMAYQDSHFKPSYQVGYVFEKIWRPATEWRVGGGFTAFLISRSDIADYFPVPAVLPAASIGYRKLSVDVTWVPGGGNGKGNVLFFSGRYNLD